MSDEEFSVSEKLKRAAQQATEASQKAPEPVDPLTIENVSEKIRENVTGDTLLGNFGRGMYRRYKWVKNAYDIGHTIWNSKTLAVLSLGASWVASKYYQGCKAVFNKFSFDEGGELIKKRAAAATVGIALFTWYGVPFTLKATTEAALIETFAYRDTLLFAKADLINENENIWGVSSCTGFPCEGEVNTTEHRMRDSMWLDIKYLFTGRVSHDPGELKGAFNSEQNACNVLQYGYRYKIPFGLYFEPFGFKIIPKNGFYPNIIEASCDSVDSDNWQQILDRKRSERPDLKTFKL